MRTATGYETPRGPTAAPTYRLSPVSVEDGGTHLSNQRYRIGPARKDQSEAEMLTRAFGCLLISLMPDAAMADALKSLIAAYEFALEDETLTPIPEITTFSTGIAIGSDEDTWI